MSTTSATIALIDDDPSVRRSLAMLLDTRGWASVEFERAQDFLDDPQPERFGCLVLDVRIPAISGLELFDTLTRRAQRTLAYLPPVLFLTGHGDIPMVVQALKQGAADFLEKPADPRTLVDAVGRALASDREARRVHEGRAGLVASINELTPREREVMALVVSGLLNKQVGGELGISEITVKAHRGQVMRKMKAESLPDLVTMAARLGLRSVPHH